jgi:hypothetical protein
MRYPTLADWEQARDSDQHSKVRELLPRLDWHALWQAEDEEEWLLYPLIPARRLIALFSAAGAGKSLLMLEMAAALSTGRKVLGHDPGRRIRVLYVDFENDPRGDVRTRLQDMGYEPGALDYLDYLSFPSLPYLDSEPGASSLLAAVEAYGPELVVIDTISRAVQGEENDNDTWLNFYKHTGLAMKQAQVALIRLDHTGKDGTKGERGGSAKRGDIDASWLLTEVVKDERYRLECVKNRFQLETKELALIRHEFPLHHTVEDSGAGGGSHEAKVRHVLQLADTDGLALSISNRDLSKWAKDRGLKYRKAVYEEANRRRKNSSGLLFDPTKTVTPGSGVTRSTKPDPQVPGSVGDSSNGNGKTPSQKPVVVTPDAGGHTGSAPSAVVTPDPPLYKRGSPHGVTENGKDSEVCEECGWDRFHKAACSMNPYAVKIEEDED